METNKPINTRKLCKGFLRKGDLNSFASLCRNYVPNNSDKGDPTLMGKLKTFLTRRNKPALLEAALAKRNTKGATERQNRMTKAVKESENIIQKAKLALNVAKEQPTRLPQAKDFVQNAMRITEELRNNAMEKSANRGYSQFSQSYYRNLNTKAESLRAEASTLASNLKKLQNNFEEKQRQNRELQEELQRQLNRKKKLNRNTIRNIKTLLRERNERIFSIFDDERVNELLEQKNTNTQEDALEKIRLQSSYYAFKKNVDDRKKQAALPKRPVTSSAAQGYQPETVSLTLPGAVASPNRASRIAALKGRKTSAENLASLPVPAQKTAAVTKGLPWSPAFKGGRRTRKNRKH